MENQAQTETKQVNNVLEVEVLLSDKIINDNPEISEVYDSEKKMLTFEVSNLIPKELVDKLSLIMPDFKGGDIIQFNPIIKAVNQLQEIKMLIPEVDEFEKNERTLIDNNKIISSFNSALTKSKKVIKQPHVDFNKKVDEIFNIFVTESTNTKNALEANFSSVVAERERIKKEKEDKKKEKELELISNLSKENDEISEKLNNQVSQIAKAEIESNLGKMITNAVTKIPTLNIEGLNALASAIKNVDEAMYISLTNQAQITQEEFLVYRQTFNANKTFCLAQVSTAINAFAMKQKLETFEAEKKAAANASFSMGVGNSTSQTEATQYQAEKSNDALAEVQKSEIIAVPLFDVSSLTSDLEKFQFITDFNNKMLEDYTKGVEQIVKITFENADLEKLKNALLEKQYPVMIDYLQKYSAYTNKKNEVVKTILK